MRKKCKQFIKSLVWWSFFLFWWLLYGIWPELHPAAIQLLGLLEDIILFNQGANSRGVGDAEDYENWNPLYRYGLMNEKARNATWRAYMDGYYVFQVAMLIFTIGAVVLRIFIAVWGFTHIIIVIRRIWFVYFIMIIAGWVSVDIYYRVIYTKYARYARIYKRSYRDIYKPEKVRQAILSDFGRNAAPTSKKIYWDKEDRKFWDFYEKQEGKNRNILAFAETSLMTNKDIYQIKKALRKFRRSKQEQDPGMKGIYGVFWFDVKDISWGMENKLFELAKVLKKDYILIAVYNRKEQKVKLMPPFLHSKQKYKYVRMRRALSDIVEVVEENEEV